MIEKKCWKIIGPKLECGRSGDWVRGRWEYRYQAVIEVGLLEVVQSTTIGVFIASHSEQGLIFTYGVPHRASVESHSNMPVAA